MFVTAPTQRVSWPQIALVFPSHPAKSMFEPNAVYKFVQILLGRARATPARQASTAEAVRTASTSLCARIPVPLTLSPTWPFQTLGNPGFESAFQVQDASSPSGTQNSASCMLPATC